MRDSKITGKERLLHINQAISDIEFYTKDVAKESFLANRVLINATLFQFAIIGEAIIHIDDEILSKYDYPWYKVRGFRNFIITSTMPLSSGSSGRLSKKTCLNLKES